MTRNQANKYYRYTQIKFTLRCMFPNFNHWDIKYTKQGLRKKRVKTFLTSSAFVAAGAILTGFYLQQNWFYQGKALLVSPVKSALQRFAGVLQTAILKL